jgi:LacI family transcriptional regulator
MKQRARPTISDVARVAGVASMTVSRVLTGSAPVKEDTAERVRKAVAMLRYEPNELARAFRWNRTNTIGLFVPELRDAAAMACAAAINDVAKMHKYAINISTLEGKSEIDSRQLKLRGVEGIIVIPGDDRSSPLNYTDLDQVPLVALRRPIPGLSVDAVLAQNRLGSRQAVKHLMSHGHERIVFLSGSHTQYTISERFEGYKEAVQFAEFDAVHFDRTDSTDELLAFLKMEIISSRPSKLAVITGDGVSSLAVLHAVKILGFRASEVLDHIGFEDFPAGDLLEPPLSVVREPLEEMGTLAANLLFSKISEETPSRDGTVMTLPMELVIRKSCGC